METNQIKNVIFAGAAAIGSFFANILGGWDAALQVLVWCMVADYITGLVVAGVFKNSGKSDSGALDSKAGFKGLCRKCSILLLVWIAVMLDNLMGAEYIRTAVCLFFVSNEALSILENLGLMGVPYPKFLKAALEAMKEKGDNGSEQ